MRVRPSIGQCVVRCAVLCVAAFAAWNAEAQAPVSEPRSIGGRRELFIDRYLIDRMVGVRQVLHSPQDAGAVVRFDRPWEGRFSGYCTVIRDGDRFRLYYRGNPVHGADGNPREVTCIAESSDGKEWQKPSLGLHTVHSTRENNVILANAAPVSHNFSPFLDQRPGVPADERYKALGGIRTTGLIPYVSADGVHWRKLREESVIRDGYFDSQNVAFWSPSEQQYVAYFRTFKDGFRRIARATSKDFVHWSPSTLMHYRSPDGEAPMEHLYTNQTHPYFRAPHLYVSTAARFLPGRRVLTAEQARAINVDPNYFNDTSDAVLLTTRGGDHYDRTFLEGFVRPGIGPENWVSRTNYPALNVVQTGPGEMSLYVQHNYGQPTSHLRRYTLRLDGFASVQAPYRGGELVTHPLVFTGDKLWLNFATSAAGGVRVEIQKPDGTPIPGFTLSEAQELIGNEIERAAAWKSGEDLSRLAGQPIRLRFVMKDADLFALQFR